MTELIVQSKLVKKNCFFTLFNQYLVLLFNLKSKQIFHIG